VPLLPIDRLTAWRRVVGEYGATVRDKGHRESASHYRQRGTPARTFGPDLGDTEPPAESATA